MREEVIGKMSSAGRRRCRRCVQFVFSFFDVLVVCTFSSSSFLSLQEIEGCVCAAVAETERRTLQLLGTQACWL